MFTSLTKKLFYISLHICLLNTSICRNINKIVYKKDTYFHSQTRRAVAKWTFKSRIITGGVGVWRCWSWSIDDCRHVTRFIWFNAWIRDHITFSARKPHCYIIQIISDVLKNSFYLLLSCKQLVIVNLLISDEHIEQSIQLTMMSDGVKKMKSSFTKLSWVRDPYEISYAKLRIREINMVTKLLCL